jgi:Protein of unknown function (DUF1360)
MVDVSPRAIKQRYTGGAERPLGSFAALMGVYGTAVLSASAYVRARRKPLPERVGMQDLGLIAVATHKLARLIAKDPVTSPVRAPFTKFEGQSGEAEVAEEVVGSGPRKAVGELVTCPFCLAQWIATAFMFGLVIRPRETRLAAALFTTVSAADFLQFAYDALQSDEDS